MSVNRSGHSPKMSDVRESLRSLTKNERPWAIRSHRSEEMSDSERIAQVVYQQWANEWIARFFEQIRNSSFAHFKKRAIRSANRWANSQPWPLGSSHEKTQDENCLFDSNGNCVNISSTLYLMPNIEPLSYQRKAEIIEAKTIKSPKQEARKCSAKMIKSHKREARKCSAKLLSNSVKSHSEYHQDFEKNWPPARQWVRVE